MKASKQADGNEFNIKTLLICLITAGALWWASDFAGQKAPKPPFFRDQEKIVYEDFLFASAIAELDFQERHPKLGIFYEYQQEPSKVLLKRTKTILVDKLGSFVQDGYPLTRLRLVKYCLGEDVFDTANEEKTVTADDNSLANKLGLALTQQKSKAEVSKDEIARALPDQCMRHFFWRTYYEKRNETDNSKIEAEALRQSIKPIQTHITNVIIADFLVVLVGLIIFCVLLRRKEFSMPCTETSDDLIYPKPKSVLFSIFSVAYVAFCGSMLCSTIDFILRNFIATPIAGGLRFLLVYPSQLVAIYFFAIKQQGITLRQGIGLRPIAEGEMKNLLLTGVAAFFVLSFLSSVSLWMAMFFPSPIIEDSSLDIIVKSVNRSITIQILIVVTILAPFVEEALFRGYLYPSLRTKCVQSTAMFLTAALFCASHFHLNPYTAFHHFLMGLTTVYVFVKTKSLIPAIVCHSIWNATVSISLVIGLCQYYSVQKIFY